MSPNDDKPLTPQQAREKLQQGLIDYLAGNNPGPIVFRLKPSKKAHETYPLKLTPQQRETLLRCTNLSRNLKNKIKQAEDGTQVIGVTRNELHKLNAETGQAVMYAPSDDKKRLTAVMGKVGKFFEEEHAEIFNLETPKDQKQYSATPACLFQFKITLLDIAPAIWRRIQVPDCTLPAFHEYIQAAFGWRNYHLHQFDIDGEMYSQPDPDGGDFDLDFEDETGVFLSELLPKSAHRTRWLYEYDFGDGWEHEILFEGFPPAKPKTKYPLCVEGERACPPEDCGGSWGYADYLAALANPQHEQHQELLAWRGPFDPEAFDVRKATKKMKMVKP